MQKALVIMMFVCFSWVLAGVVLAWSTQAMTLWFKGATDNTSWLLNAFIGLILTGFGIGLLVCVPIVYQLEKTGKA